MSKLDRLLKGYAPPPVPAGLAQRAVAEAIKHPQERIKALSTPRRRDRRGGWKRPLWIGAASLALAFTSAVAASVVSGGRIEIPVVQPVVQEVVEAVPVLHQAQARRSPERVAEAKPEPETVPVPEETPNTSAAQLRPGQPGWRKAQVVRTLTAAKQHVEARRAAGLPTPRADRIDRTAEAIVTRRQAKGLPTPPVDKVKAALALRELKRSRDQRALSSQTGLSPQQLERVVERMPPDRRARFEAMSTEQQQALIRRFVEHRRMRQVMRSAEPVENSTPAENSTTDPQPSEGFSEPPR